MTVDPSLTPAALDVGGVAIAGVTMVDEVEQIRPPMNEALLRVLEASHPGVRLVPPDSVRRILGPAATREILFRFQQRGALDEASRASLVRALAPASRYLLFARVEKSSIHAPGRPRPSAIRYGTVGTTWTARRDARVHFTLFDLRDGTIALDATYASSSANALADSAAQRELPRGRPTVTGPGETYPSVPDFTPETPSLAAAIVEACRAFAADLPGTAGTTAAPAP